MDAVCLRPANLDDVDAILELWKSAAENTARPVDTPEAIISLINRDPEALTLAVLDGGIVGSIIAGWDGWRCHLYRLAVHPSDRRLGLARRLLEHAKARLNDLGATRIDAMVLDSNDLGQSIWRASGYERQADWSRWVKPGEGSTLDRRPGSRRRSSSTGQHSVRRQPG